MKKQIFITVIVLALTTQCTFAQVQFAPFTGRIQMILLNESDLILESQLRYSAFKLSTQVLPDSDPDVVRVRRIGNEIVKATQEIMEAYGMSSRISKFKFEFNVVKSDVVNAWCMPGGKVVVYTGIMPFCKDDGLLAALLAHEIAHAIAQHGNEQLSQELAFKGIKEVLKGEFSDYLAAYKDIFNIVYDVSSELGLLAYSRTHEYEADLIGMYIMAYAGYKPENAKIFWENMLKANGSNSFDFLSTHPADKSRLDEISKNIPEVESKFYKGK